MRRLIYLFYACILLGCVSTQNENKELNFAESLALVPQNAVLADSTYFIWGASPVKGEDGKYHLFYSRWEKKYGFSAWATRSEIAHGVSDNLFGPYQFSDVTLPERGSEYWDGHCTHNPTIQKFDGKYYLYYMGNRGDRKDLKSGLNWTHRNNQRIGVAVASSPYGPWTRYDKPLVDASEDPAKPDALAVNNPSVTKTPDGKYLMVYKAIGKQKPLPFGGPVVHLTALADSPTGPFVKNPEPVFTAEGTNFAAEDPYIWQQDGNFYAIVKDMGGVFTHKGRSLALFTSADGIDWHQAKHNLVSTLNINWEGGHRDSVNRLERPQLYIENGKPLALFLAVIPLHQKNHSFNVHIPIK